MAKLRMRPIRLNVVSAPNAIPRYMSDAEFEFECLRNGSTDGTPEIKLKFERRRAEKRKRKEAQKEAEDRRRAQARIREERLRERQEEERNGDDLTR
jgi:hypothetical protein